MDAILVYWQNTHNTPSVLYVHFYSNVYKVVPKSCRPRAQANVAAVF